MRLTPIMDNHGHQRKTYNKKWHPKSSSPLETTKWMKDIEFHNRNPFVHIYIYHSVPSNGETIKNRAAKLHSFYNSHNQLPYFFKIDLIKNQK